MGLVLYHDDVSDFGRRTKSTVAGQIAISSKPHEFDAGLPGFSRVLPSSQMTDNPQHVEPSLGVLSCVQVRH